MTAPSSSRIRPSEDYAAEVEHALATVPEGYHTRPVTALEACRSCGVPVLGIGRNGVVTVEEITNITHHKHAGNGIELRPHACPGAPERSAA